MFFFKLLLRTFDVFRQLRPCHARRVSRTRQLGNGNVLESTAREIHKKLMAPKWLTSGMSASLPRHGPKWKLAIYGLKPFND